MDKCLVEQRPHWSGKFHNSYKCRKAKKPLGIKKETNNPPFSQSHFFTFHPPSLLDDFESHFSSPTLPTQF